MSEDKNTVDRKRERKEFLTGRNVSFTYPGRKSTPVVKNVSFDISNSGITAIIGESGSGKSTLLKLIYGLIDPAEGEITINGEAIPHSQEKLIPGHVDMKIVTQDFDTLNLYAKVWDNIASQLPNTDLVFKEKKTREVLELLKIEHLSEKRVADISGGERQRTAIAKALVHDPKVLLMDEPFNQVDSAFRNELQNDVREIVNNTGLTIILVSHNPEEVLAIADEVIILKEGEIMESGLPFQLYNRPENTYSARLLAKSNILSSEEAAHMHIHAENNVIIHREWIEINNRGEYGFLVEGIFFRGFYYEILITDDVLALTVLTYEAPSFELGEKVGITVRQHHETKD